MNESTIFSALVRFDSVWKNVHWIGYDGTHLVDLRSKIDSEREKKEGNTQRHTEINTKKKLKANTNLCDYLFVTQPNPNEESKTK